MIVPTMTCKEMFDGLEKDFQKIQIRIDKNRPKAIKYFKTTRSFPMWYTDEYKIPVTNNHYIIFYYAGNEREIEKPRISYFCIVFCGNQRFVIKGMRGGYQHTLASELVMIPQIHAYTSHFLERYRERCHFNKKLTTNEIAGLFLSRNPEPIPILLNENVKKNYEKYGEFNKYGMLFPDGFCFTQTANECRMSEDGNLEHDNVDAIMIVYTTFLNEKNLSATQKVAIEKENLETWKRCFEALQMGIKT